MVEKKLRLKEHEILKIDYECPKIAVIFFSKIKFSIMFEFLLFSTDTISNKLRNSFRNKTPDLHVLLIYSRKGGISR